MSKSEQVFTCSQEFIFVHNLRREKLLVNLIIHSHKRDFIAILIIALMPEHIYLSILGLEFSNGLNVKMNDCTDLQMILAFAGNTTIMSPWDLGTSVACNLCLLY